MADSEQKLTGVVFSNPVFDKPHFNGLKASKTNGFPVYIEGNSIVLDTEEYGLMKVPMTPDRDLAGREEFIGTLQGRKSMTLKAGNTSNLFVKGFFGQPNTYINVDGKYSGAKLYGQFGMKVPTSGKVTIRIRNNKETLEWVYLAGYHKVVFGSEFMLGSGSIHVEIETLVSGVVTFDAVPYVKVGGVY